MRAAFVPLIVVLGLGGSLHAADWPAWRGPTGQGFCEEKNVLQKWSDKENVRWKIPLAHQGNSTPIVWKDRIFLTQANTGGSVRSLLCFARADGKLLWQKDVEWTAKERNWNPNWYANASPVTDGERVVACFASAGVYCFDFEGKELWKRTDLGEWQHAFGSGSSPVIYRDTVIQWCGPNENKGRNFLLAMDRKTGATVWEHEEKVGSWGTPLIAKVGDRDQLLLALTPALKGLDPGSGSEIWSCDGLNKYVYTTPLVGNGVAVAMSGYMGAALAVKLGGTKDITADRLWHHPKNIQRVGSGMIVGNHVYIVEETGIPHCYDLTTGEEVWQIEKRPEAGGTWGSMVHAEGRLYVVTKNAQTLVLKADPKYELLGTNSLGPGESSNSSLAISNGDVFLRTFKHLWCLAETKKP